MMLLGFWNQLKKQLKKKLRLKRRWLNLAVVLLAAGLFAAGAWMLRGSLQEKSGRQGQEQSVFSRAVEAYVQPEEEVRAMVKDLNGQRDAFVKKSYVCGEELQRIGIMNAADILAYHKAHPSMTVSLGDSNRVYFIEKVDDLSPQCKNNAYFGLDANGNLSLFEGIPGSGGQNVLRTFFQLNIRHLESSLPRETVKQLYHGVRVRDLADYNSVLSTLSDYAIEETEKAMQVTPSS
ncbi:BofC C-terminal domain-containing protein [Paenibacillus ehimensis]|uniref:BofC C-terminal domain-containing protein n=1 Tax=Paenibacillus ehimensis TaxID=79264 RepID=A0ABT8VED4_9BACL|nr:BofC C-terminal domain-containing protein [Paenibacillus ehimensis]MDO3679330.1 BofC C-terminal domain-containing protein [Paenibacillus ehimensis]MEC0213891.1 BofC C-terminal domain-containing protein [Paenibacillus ehimensis]